MPVGTVISVHQGFVLFAPVAPVREHSRRCIFALNCLHVGSAPALLGASQSACAEALVGPAASSGEVAAAPLNWASKHRDLVRLTVVLGLVAAGRCWRGRAVTVEFAWILPVEPMRQLSAAHEFPVSVVHNNTFVFTAPTFVASIGPTCFKVIA